MLFFLRGTTFGPRIITSSSIATTVSAADCPYGPYVRQQAVVVSTTVLVWILLYPARYKPLKYRLLWCGTLYMATKEYRNILQHQNSGTPRREKDIQGNAALGSLPMVNDKSTVDLDPSAESGQRDLETMFRDEGYRPSILSISHRHPGISSVLENTTHEQPELLEMGPVRSDSAKPSNTTLPQRSDTEIIPEQACGSRTAPPSAHDWVVGRQSGVVCRGLIAEGAFGEVHSVTRGPKFLANFANRCWTGFFRYYSILSDKYRR